MKQPIQWLVLLTSISGLALLAACSSTSAKETKPQPAVVQDIAGSDLKQLVLKERAAERLALQTVPVREVNLRPRGAIDAPPEARLVVPYAAVIYDQFGATWTYVNREPLTYVREPITIDYVSGSQAVLLTGPPPDTLVVTAGAAELYGEETGVGK